MTARLMSGWWEGSKKRKPNKQTNIDCFSFTAESEREKEEWIEAVQESIAETLSDYEVAEKLWFNEANRSCADCRAPQPEWAGINLGVVICKKCAGKSGGASPLLNVGPTFPQLPGKSMGAEMRFFGLRVPQIGPCGRQLVCVSALTRRLFPTAFPGDKPLRGGCCLAPDSLIYLATVDAADEMTTEIKPRVRTRRDRFLLLDPLNVIRGKRLIWSRI